MPRVAAGLWAFTLLCVPPAFAVEVRSAGSEPGDGVNHSPSRRIAASPDPTLIAGPVGIALVTVIAYRDQPAPAAWTPWSPAEFTDDELEALAGSRVLAAARKAFRAGYRARVRRPSAEEGERCVRPRPSSACSMRTSRATFVASLTALLALASAGLDSVDCQGRRPTGSSSRCTLVQTRLPDRALAASRDGAHDLGEHQLVAFFSDDAVYHNIPIDPVTGVDVIEPKLVASASVSSRSGGKAVVVSVYAPVLFDPGASAPGRGSR